MNTTAKRIPFERRCEIGERLRLFRKSKNMTQEKMAEILGISKTYYGQAERGISSLGEYKLLILSDVLDADIGYILTGKRYHYIQLTNNTWPCPTNRLESVGEIVELLLKMP